MADDASPSEARAARFDIALRGYDRTQVDAYLDETASLLAELKAAAEAVEDTALAVGVDDPEALAKELRRIGKEVDAILEAARSAAEGMRKRSKTDADRWRKAAEAESTEMLESATEQSQSMRATAWNEGTSLLNSAVAEAKSLLAQAQEDALFMRAEAERDALRLTSDAKRDKDEALRAARLEAESIIAEARTESDGVLAAAQKQAELAQERARALEDRRSELLSELEATRASIAHLEEEIDSRRQELETPEPEPEPLPASVHHGHDVGSVRIVAPSKAVTLRPVDPDELVEEVRAMRTSEAAAAAAAAAAAEQPETVAVIAPPPTTAPAVVLPPEPAPEPEPTEAAVEVEEPAISPSTSDEIGSLFARLKDDTTEVPITQPTQPAEPSTQKPDTAPTPEVDATSTSTVADAPTPTPTPTPEGAPEPDPAPTPVPEAAARNSALKSVKKSLVDLQNLTLEELRTDAGWLPPSGFTDVFAEAFASLAEATGRTDGTNQASAFAADLDDAVTSAIETARSASKGDRAVAAAASKVFRTWRSDEAERRLNALN